MGQVGRSPLRLAVVAISAAAKARFRTPLDAREHPRRHPQGGPLSHIDLALTILGQFLKTGRLVDMFNLG